MLTEEQVRRGEPGERGGESVESETEPGSRKDAERPATGEAAGGGRGPGEKSAGPAAPTHKEKPNFEDWLLGIV